MADPDTSLTITGVQSGVVLSTSGVSGTLTIGGTVAGSSGYAIAMQTTSQGLAYPSLSVLAQTGITDPPTLTVTADYAQSVDYGEVDLELRFTDIPPGTQAQVTCSESSLAISRQPISGSSLLGSSEKNLGPFTAKIGLNLWLPKATMPKTASLTLSLSQVESGSGGPVKKTLLQKFALNLGA
jgi:hypothetical protein